MIQIKWIKKTGENHSFNKKEYKKDEPEENQLEKMDLKEEFKSYLKYQTAQ